MSTYQIKFEKKDGFFGNFERKVCKEYTISLKKQSISFDLLSVEFFGAYPACLLFTWIYSLLKKGIHVHLTLPQTKSSFQVTKTLVNLGIIDNLKTFGLQVNDYQISELAPPSFPLSIIDDKNKIPDVLSHIKKKLSEYGEYNNHKIGHLKDILDYVAKEILENSFNHNTGNEILAYLSLNHATSNTSKRSLKSFMKTFNEGDEYIEICVGDTGKGIIKTLQNVIPKTYKTPFPSNTRKYIKKEDILQFAFEYSSTSDEASRLQRLQNLFKTSSIDLLNVASGLYIAINFAREYEAQFIVRTPYCFLSFDFTEGLAKPIVKGYQELGFKANDIKGLPGTHYVFRFKIGAILVAEESKIQPSTDLKDYNISVINPFPLSLDNKSDEAYIFHSAISDIEKSIFNFRNNQNSCIVIDRPLYPISAKIASYFLYSLLNIYSVNTIIIWNYSKGTFASLKKTSKKALNNSVIVGDISSNVFHQSHQNPDGFDDIQITFDTLSINRIRKYVADGRELILSKIMNSPEIRLTNKVFYVEKRYFTKLFFNLYLFYENSYYYEYCAFWLVERIFFKVELVVVYSKLLYHFGKAFINNYKLKYGFEPQIVVVTTPINPAQLIIDTIDHKNKSTLVLTDYIITANNISNLLAYLVNLKVQAVFSAIDARKPLKLSKPIIIEPVGKGSKVLAYDVFSIIKEHIKTYSSEIIDVRQEEPLFLIDSVTRKPSSIVREVKPKYPLEDIIEYAVDSKSLYIGHYNFDDTHFTYAIYLKPFFRYLLSDLLDWVVKQIGYIEDILELEVIDKYIDVYVYNPSGVLEDFINHLVSDKRIKRINIMEVDLVDLKTPNPYDPNVSSYICVGILPIVTSGYKAVLFSEYISRFNPKAILLLSLFSKPDPYLFSFFNGIKSYHSGKYQFSSYVNFPIEGYFHESYSCPLCRKREILNGIILNKSNTLQKVIDSQVELLNYQSVYEFDSYLLFDEFADDLKRKTYLRALYESSEYNMQDRKKLNKILINEESNRDLFLEIVNEEFLANQFSIDVIQRRLSEAFPHIIERIYTIVEERNSKKITKVIFAIEQIFPGTLSNDGLNILSSVIDSTPAVEEIAIAMIVFNCFDIDILTWKDYLNDIEDEHCKSLINEMLDYINERISESKVSIEKALESYSLFYGDIKRSSSFIVNLDEIIRLSEEGDLFIVSQLKAKMDDVWFHFRKYIANYYEDIKNSDIWEVLNSRKEFGSKFHTLRKEIHSLNKQIRDLNDNTYSKNLINNINLLTKNIVDKSELLADDLYDFVCYPVHCSATKLPTVLKCYDRSILHLKKDIDYNVNFVFFPLDTLNYVSGQLINNWIKHKKRGKRGKNVIFRIRQDDQSVIFDFEDDIEGMFDTRGVGGIHSLIDECKQFGASTEITKDGNRKSFSICLRKFNRNLN